MNDIPSISPNEMRAVCVSSRIPVFMRDTFSELSSILPDFSALYQGISFFENPLTLCRHKSKSDLLVSTWEFDSPLFWENSRNHLERFLFIYPLMLFVVQMNKWVLSIRPSSWWCPFIGNCPICFIFHLASFKNEAFNDPFSILVQLKDWIFVWQ